MKPLANDFVTIYKSPNPKKAFAGTPAIYVLGNGRYVFSQDLFGDNESTVDPEGNVDKVIPHPVTGNYHIGQIFTSDDKGQTWQKRARRNFFHGTPFEAGSSVYILGHCDDIIIYRSDDGGYTWDEGTYLTEGEHWHSCATKPWVEDGYLNIVLEVMENTPDEIRDGWNVSSHAPVVMRAKVTDDLTKRENWIFSNRLRFRDVVKEDELDLYGVPFFTTTLHKSEYDDGRTTDNMSGWLEPSIVRIKDEKHYWYDPSGKTLHILLRAHTSGTGYACLLKAVIGEENGKETVTVMTETNPSGKRVVYLPFPGGQIRFQVVWDEKSELFWLLSSQATDSMTKKEFLSPKRYNLPYDERHRLQLCFSKNLVDWCFAGIAAMGDDERQSRHYVSMDIEGDDIVFVSRSGSPESISAHNVDLATFHRIKNFRDLVY